MTKPRTALLIALGVVSALSTLLGIRAMLAFDHTPGSNGAVPINWPAASTIKPPGNRPELLVFVHPMCSCTAATIGELAKLSALQKAGSAPAITILFFRPRDAKWTATSLWDKALELPGGRAVWDDGGREAARFGALTSGQTLLYDAAGNLLFHGGVTGSRGHSGDNYGLDELLASLESGRPARRPTQVFGCALQWSNSTEVNQ